jgi:hypothetical protein
VRKRDLMDLIYWRTQADRPTSSPPDPGSAGRRLVWAVVGAFAFLAAMYGLHLT